MEKDIDSYQFKNDDLKAWDIKACHILFFHDVRVCGPTDWFEFLVIRQQRGPRGSIAVSIIIVTRCHCGIDRLLLWLEWFFTPLCVHSGGMIRPPKKTSPESWVVIMRLHSYDSALQGLLQVGKLRVGS